MKATKLWTVVALIGIVFGSLSFSTANAAIKAGAACKKVGQTSSMAGTKFICAKSGKKTVWKRMAAAKPTAATPKASPSTTAPVALPTSFSDLVENRNGISQAAWTKVNRAILVNSSKLGTYEIYTGPKTKPYFEDYQKAAELVSKLFSNMEEPASNVVIRYKYEDLSWAEAKVVEILPKSEIERFNRDEGGRLLTSNCDPGRLTCEGSKQLTTTGGVNLVLQGVPQMVYANDLAGKDRFYSGMLEAHEYFHSLQRIPLTGRNLQQSDYPPVWFVEGSAEWVQNAAINYADFKKYKEYFELDCNSKCKSLTKSDITKILQEATNSYWPSDLDYFLNYSLGSIIIESLVSISSPESILLMYRELATKVGFAAAFNKVYGTPWSDAISILSEAVYLNLQNV
jgi:hypothetical protein